jgi:hypothetical protein
MQRNLKWRLSLAFSLLLLTGTLAACNGQVVRPAEAAASEKTGPAETREVQSPQILRLKSGAKRPAEQESDESVQKLVADASQLEPSQADVPPPPLGIVPVSSVRRANKPTLAVETDDTVDPPASTAIKSSQRNSGSPTNSSRSSHPEKLPTATRVNSTRTSATSSSVTLPRAPVFDQSSAASRKQQSSEQEKRARKYIQERASQQARQRHARLNARYWGNAQGFGVHVTSQMALVAPKETLPVWPVLAGSR